MTETSQIEEMKRYLFGEMSDKERETVEERIFDDTDFFDELTDLENDLVDRFVCGKLIGEDLPRFEQSLSKIPERREKIANARALQTIIAEERGKSFAVAAAPSFWEKISNYFNLQIPTLKLAAGALAVLLVCAAAFLLYNLQKQNEFAEIERQRETERIEKENRLKQLEEQKRIEDQRRQNQINNQQSENSNINVQPNNTNRQIEEKERNNEIEKLKQEVEDDKRKNIPPSNRNEVKPSKEFLAFSFLPFRTAETGTFNPTADIATIAGEQKIKINVPLPLDKNYESIELVSRNGRDKKNIPEGAKSVVFYLPPISTQIDIRATERNTGNGSKSLGIFVLEVKKIKK